MLLKQLFDAETSTYTYLLADPETGEAAIIDPVLEQVERDATLVEELGLSLRYVLETHLHADHVTGSGHLRVRTGALTAVSAAAEVACADLSLTHGDVLPLGRHRIEVRSTPGHTDGCVTYVVEADGQTFAFTGDALLIRGCGRTDFQQGDAATLYRSVHEQIFSLPPETVIYPGHDYRGHSASTVAEERAHNPRLRDGIDEAGFVGIMGRLTLSQPRRIHESLPANQVCGMPRLAEVEAGALSMSEAVRIVDVRTSAEFDGPLGHLPGAVLAPLNQLDGVVESWPRATPLLLVCRSGQRSAVACQRLIAMGFTDVTNLTGGMLAWRATQGVA